MWVKAQRREPPYRCRMMDSETGTNAKLGTAAIWADAARYRQLAQERRAAGDIRIADKLMELVRDLEAKAERFERVPRYRAG